MLSALLPAQFESPQTDSRIRVSFGEVEPESIAVTGVRKLPFVNTAIPNPPPPTFQRRPSTAGSYFVLHLLFLSTNFFTSASSSFPFCKSSHFFFSFYISSSKRTCSESNHLFLCNSNCPISNPYSK